MKSNAPMKFFQDCASLDCLQFPGHANRTVLCFIPPSPADWMRCEKPSLRFEDTTTWQKPLVRSAAMEVLMFWTQKDTQEGRYHFQFFTDSLKCEFWTEFTAP